MTSKKPGRAPKYPLIECADRPGDPLPGYVVCRHVIADPSISLGPIERASVTHLGVVVCAACAASAPLSADDVTTACAHYVLQHFGVPL